uniref:Tc1-like transposase DDE domain-containing protein n=1 Tax=Phytophthora ramorum TaxID=164328 RepID=H3GNM6_PHYRM
MATEWPFWRALFVHDNTPVHTAKLTAGYLRELQLISLGHPSQNPDLNPIEDVWFIMKKELNKNLTTFIDDLKMNLKKMWANIDDDLVKKCVLSMPKRLKAV